jgi:high-affinity iron transporter
MTWSDALPNLLIGLREGLEAGLVVSILLAALRKTAVDGRRVSSAPVWLGVLGAVAVSAAFATVLTFSTSVLSSRAQEAVGGVLSVLAVALVTGMVFWMRRTAASLAGELRSQVSTAVRTGAGALAVTAFLAVGREGLETTLFLWTAVKASGQTVAPLLGAALGLGIAVLLCWLLYQRAIRINLGVFFSRTAIALIVIAAGVLAYGLGDLQDAGLLPGHSWLAFDISGTVATNSWWMTLITGATELSPTMTVLQVAAWVVYLAVVVPVFVRGGWAPKPAAAPATAEPAVAQAAEKPVAGADSGSPGRWDWLSRRSPLTIGAVLIVVPALAAAVAIVALPSASTGAATRIDVTDSACADGWHSAHAGSQTFTVSNKSDKAGEINLDDASGSVVAEIETLGPATTADLTADLSGGTYTFRCLMSGRPVTVSQTVQVTGGAARSGPAPVKPVTLADLRPASVAYRHYVAPQLVTLAKQVATLSGDLAHHKTAKARTDWLAAQLTWDKVGAAYDSFGDLGDAIDGLPQGLPGGVHDSGFTGLHRLEYGLWHGQSASQLRPVAATLAKNVATLEKKLPQITVDPTDLPIRAHEILEDALRDRLSGMADEGSGAAYPETYADVQGTRVVLAELAPLITARSPHLVDTADRQLDALAAALLTTKRADGGWTPLDQAPQDMRDRVDAAIGAVLETLADVPDLLEVPPSR